MTKLRLDCGASALAIGAALYAVPAIAQNAPAPAAQSKPADAAAAGDQIVITASTGDRSRLRSSISVSQVSQAAILDFTPRSEAEVFRLIPGIHAEDTAGPGGNSNIGVRGIPVITGGSEFVALEEDGLPVTLFGDIQFGNNDYWVRFDDNVERVEAVRGGSASTFASQAPGAVINYISKTGNVAGGEIALSTALNYNEHRADFDYGSPLGHGVRFHVGGFFKTGHGPTHIGYRAVKGYQIKANVTQEFDGGHGYVRLNFKRLDDREPTFTTMPSLATFTTSGGITDITGFSPLPNFDARRDSNQSIYNQTFQYVTDAGQLATARMEGIHPKVTVLGGELHWGNGVFTVDDSIRKTWMKGVFATQFFNTALTSSIIGSTVNGQTVGTIRYANGPNQGRVYTGTYVNNNPNIDTIMRDMGSFANNLALTGKFDLGFGHFTAKAGWFHMSQNISQEWHVNPQLNEFNGRNPAQLDLFSTTGTQLSANGQTGFNNNWGNCCARSVDLKYTDDAPFLSADFSGGGLDLDASVRFDNLKARGTAQAGVAGPNFAVSDALGSAVLPSLIPGGAVELLDYSKHYTSWSVGALYALADNASIFARVSRGGRFNADRRTLGGNFNADGSLDAQGQATAVNFVTQQEAGLKARGRLAGGRYTAELTLFRAQLTDNNFDFTRINNPPPNNNPIISNVYHAYGVEFSGSYHQGHFNVIADATYNHSRIVGSTTTPAIVGDTPHSTPAFYWQVSPSYDVGMFALGVSANGQTSTWSDDFNTVKIKGQTYLNGFVKVRPIERLELGLNVNNIFNTLGYRGSGSLLVTGATQGIFENSAVLGRTITVSARYKF